jgi:hypothetical protein
MSRKERGEAFMRILLVNPPHPAIGSRIPHEHLPPLGLLALGGRMSTQEMVAQAVTFAP